VDEYTRLSLPKQLRTLPDFLVTTPNGEQAWLVEVKMRSQLNKVSFCELGKVLEKQMDHWPGVCTILFLGTPTGENRNYIQDHVRVIRPKDLSYLLDTSIAANKKWCSLPLLHDIFDRIDVTEFFTRADQIVPTIKALTYANY
jgi:hypothetical protein